uniref:Uncharacterized protein n=1 Tax=Streptomyces tenjimariensis TaxID=29308 RepID=Q2UZF0_9ACTN|nr:hypothetical protein [Streptomyces tenjimariensis]
MTLTARLSNGFLGGWEVYVVLHGRRGLEWPAREFGRTAPVPTLNERAAALAALGYEVEDGAVWTWQEHTYGGDERVRLFASVEVRPVQTGEGP